MFYKLRFVLSLLPIVLLTNVVLSQQNNVKMPFSVLDENGKFFADLKASDIKLFKGNITSIELKTENPLEVFLMIDASASQEAMLPFEKKAAQEFINNILDGKKDKIAIAKFTGAITLEQDLTNNFKKANEQIEKIEFEPPPGYIGGGVLVGTKPPAKNQIMAGSTSIWESIKEVLNAFSKLPSTNSRRVIILISDGLNTYGDTKLKEVVELSLETNIPISAIGIGDNNYGGVDKKSLQKLSKQSGGIAIFPKKKPTELSLQLKTVESILRSNYEITFSPELLNSKNRLQEMKIEIVNPELRKRKLQVIQPKGFFLN